MIEGPDREILEADRMSGPLVPVARWISAVLLAAGIGTIIFLIVAEEFAQRGWSEITFNTSLGIMMGERSVEERAEGALSIAGDSAGPTGLLWTFIFAVGLVALYGLTVHLFVRARWYFQGLILAAGAWLLVSLAYFPALSADTAQQISVGPFGVGGGGRSTPMLFLFASLAFGMIAARVFSLVAEAPWWRVKLIDQREALNRIQGMEDLEPEVVPEDLLQAPGVTEGRSLAAEAQAWKPRGRRRRVPDDT